MTAAIYREFVLRTPAEGAHLVQFLKHVAGPYAEKGTPLRVIVTDEEADRAHEQIKCYWGHIIKPISEQAWVNGRQHGMVAWHEYMCQKFLPAKEIILPDGEIIMRRASIAKGQISMRAMAKFSKEVEAYGAQELGVQFEDEGLALPPSKTRSLQSA